MFAQHVTQFAVDTKHRPHQYETPQQTNEIARKMIAASVRVVPWGDVYKYVSPGDMKRIMRRIKPLDLGEMAPPLHNFYKDLSNVVIHNRDYENESVLDAFEEKVYPQLGASYDDSEEEKSLRKNALVLFLARCANADVRSLVNSLYPNYEDKQERERVYDAIQEHEILDKDDNPADVARDIGFLIRNLYFPTIEDGSLYLVEPIKYEAPKSIEHVEIESIPEPDWKEEEDQEINLDENIDVKEWKRRHALDSRFSSKNVAKQILTMYYAPECKTSLKSNSLLGKYQTCDDLDTEYITRNISELWNGLLQDKSKSIESLMETPQIVDFVKEHVRDKSQTTKVGALKDFIQKKAQEIDATFVGAMLEI